MKEFVFVNLRSSHMRFSLRKGVLRNFAKFTGALAQVFSCEFCEISKNTSFKEHLWATASENCRLASRIFITD